jgi:hypothetical protein
MEKKNLKAGKSACGSACADGIGEKNQTGERYLKPA